MRTPDDCLEFEDKSQIVERAKNSRVIDINWSGPGWYYIFRYSQPCPRGCCRDSVYKAISSAEWCKDLAEEIKDLSSQLREARKR